ncbi:unnamed protein product [Boreogadus saida]
MTPTRVRVLAIAYLYWPQSPEMAETQGILLDKAVLGQALGEFGALSRLVQELRLGDGDAFKNFFRLPKLMFDSVLSVATCILHNLLRSTEARPPSSDEAVPLEGGRRLGTNNSTKEVMQERERFMTYFNSAAGEVSWQNNIV